MKKSNKFTAILCTTLIMLMSGCEKADDNDAAADTTDTTAIITEITGSEKKASATLNEQEIGQFFNKITKLSWEKI